MELEKEFKNIIINNVEEKGFSFKSLDEAKKYHSLAIFDKADTLAIKIKDDIVFTDEKTLYFYNKNTRIWQENTVEQYESFVCDFMNLTSRIVNKLKLDYCLAAANIGAEVDKTKIKLYHHIS